MFLNNCYFTDWLTHWLTHSLTHSLAHSLENWEKGNPEFFQKRKRKLNSQIGPANRAFCSHAFFKPFARIWFLIFYLFLFAKSVSVWESGLLTPSAGVGAGSILGPNWPGPFVLQGIMVLGTVLHIWAMPISNFAHVLRIISLLMVMFFISLTAFRCDNSNTVLDFW